MERWPRIDFNLVRTDSVHKHHDSLTQQDADSSGLHIGELTTGSLRYWYAYLWRKPFVIATFLSFALFPLAIVFASNFALLVLAFVIGGLREIGEPARKAMIVDFASENVRARSVGLYYLVRSLSITPAALIGGLLWKIRPEVPFITASIIGIIGTIIFAATVEERFAS